MLMAIFMTVSGKMIKLTVKANILIQMEPLIKEVGNKINSMAKEENFGLMVLSIMEIIKMERRRGTVSSTGQINLLIKVISSTTIFKEKASILGLI